MRYLITGGTGFIGSRLALRCLKDGHGVCVLGQENTPAEEENRAELDAAGAEVVLGSVTDTERLAEATREVDVVFHLAAAHHEMGVPDDHFSAVNVDGTRYALEAAEAAGVERFVHASTIGVYGVQDGTLDESSPADPDNIYGVTKLEAERLVLSHGSRPSTIAIRIPEVYGPGDRRLLKLFRLIDKGTFFHIGPGTNLHHLIYVEDLIDGLLTASRHPAAPGELFILAGPDAVTTNEMVESIARALAKKPPRIRVPLFPFALAATLFEVTLRPLGIQPPLHRRRLDFFRKNFELSTERARERLGFDAPTGFAEGARQTAEWYRATGQL